MSGFRTALTLLALASFWLPITSVALDAATELRLRSIEARLPDADELADLERKVNALSPDGGASEGVAATGGSMFSVIQDLQALQEEVRKLNGEVEELKHLAKQSETGQRELYQSLDKRLTALEEGGGSSSTGSSEGNTSGGGSSQSQSPADKEAAEQAYNAAYAKLKAGEYAESRKAFNEFVENYPNSSYNDNAWYWLGQAHYVDRDYEPSLSAFRKVLSDYPDSNKAGSALYYIGVIQDEKGSVSDARTTLIKVIEDYPEDNAADLARKRLKAIGGNG